MRRLIIGFCAFLLVAGGALLFASAVQAGQTKVDVCHKGRVINVATPAVPAHLAHGDAVFEDEICGDGLDNDCDGAADEDEECGPALLVCECTDENGEVTQVRDCLTSVALCLYRERLCSGLCDTFRSGPISCERDEICD